LIFKFLRALATRKRLQNELVHNFVPSQNQGSKLRFQMLGVVHGDALLQELDQVSEHLF
jgi:hypothetical protein